MLLEDFYSVQHLKPIDEHSFEMAIALNVDHDIFKGHFPEFPVTPGVAMLQIIKNGLELHLSQSLQLRSSSQIKFLNFVNPNEQSALVFNISFAMDGNSLHVKNSTTFTDGRSVLKCNVTFVQT